MGETTKIEWTHHTFNPWIGCTKVHTGCKGCYAEISPAAKFKGIRWGAGAPRHVTGEDNWKKPLAWSRAAAKAGERRRVFCASLADVLDEGAPAEAQARLWDLIRATARVCSSCLGTGIVRISYPPGYELTRSDPREAQCACIDQPRDSGGLDWLLLTKRPEGWRLIPEDVRPLVWLGTSISDQKTADEWVPRLLAAEGFRLRFLSVEPMIGPVDLRRWLPLVFRHGIAPNSDGTPFALPACGGGPGVQWVICGGESGTGARRFDIAWGRSLRDQCRAAGVPFFWKQLGTGPSLHTDLGRGHHHRDGDRPFLAKDSKGGDMSEWPEDCRVREFPEAAR